MIRQTPTSIVQRNTRSRPCGTIVGEALLDAIKQRSPVERLSQKALGADRHRLIVQVFIWQSRHQNYRYCSTLFAELSYESKTTHSGHGNVSDETIE
jgi:hypothetical protein